MTTFTATYSPDDNKLRLYASSRLDKETYERVKAAGFKWAPKQDLFVAPMWTPHREDLLIELAGEIGDDDSSLVDRAEERADRFEVYGEKRLADAHAAHKAVDAIADGIPFGQPILIGHHSEKHARRDAAKIENGMRKAVKMWRTSQYWESRAAGALRHAKYKELPAVRARRIKTIEADKRRVERAIAESAAKLKLWNVEGLTLERARKIANYANPGVCRQSEGRSGYWNTYDVLQPDGERYSACPSMTVEQVQEAAKRAYSAGTEERQRWIEHYDNRLTYERAMLEESGATALLDPKPRRELPPLLNYRAPGGSITTANMYDRSRDITYPQIDMTKAEYARINADYKGARWSKDKTHRFRTTMQKHSLVCVFLTDSKVHDIPSKPEPAQSADDVAEALADLDAADAAKARATVPEETAAVADPIADALALADAIAAPPAPADLPDPSPPADFEAMARTLKAGGVQVISAPQLFPTPAALAAEMVQLAGVEVYHRVLEPSAGTGAIWRELSGHRVAIEINPRLAEGLRQMATRDDTIICADFLDMAGATDKFDRILMNPPFVNGADIKHIEHARKFLKPGGRLVAICADGPRQRERLRPLASKWRSLPAGTFKESGTMVNAALLVIDG
jgi:protein-L-isoaspartate O-methyltransferase